MKTLYRVNWSTLETETATLLDEHNINEGASAETWLCKDSNGRKFTCSKFDCGWQFSELAAWQEFEVEMSGSISTGWLELTKIQKELEKAEIILFAAQKKILDLTAAQ